MYLLLLYQLVKRQWSVDLVTFCSSLSWGCEVPLQIILRLNQIKRFRMSSGKIQDNYLNAYLHLSWKQVSWSTQDYHKNNDELVFVLVSQMIITDDSRNWFKLNWEFLKALLSVLFCLWTIKAPPCHGTWWRLGWVDSFQPEGRGLDSRSTRHVETLGKFFTVSGHFPQDISPSDISPSPTFPPPRHFPPGHSP